ncbi:MAG TPA: DUF5666 domain-containing protein [Verrucomicrobiae bacterium]|nr:DUF5666 domain-containing protein [Verrucomicrobiae bacterium]
MTNVRYKQFALATACLLITGLAGFSLGIRWNDGHFSEKTPQSTPVVSLPTKTLEGTLLSPNVADLGNVTLNGTVRLVSSEYAVIQTRSGTNYEFIVNGQTVVFHDYKKSSIGTIKVGDTVQMSGIVQSDGSIRAFRVSD